MRLLFSQMCKSNQRCEKNIRCATQSKTLTRMFRICGFIYMKDELFDYFEAPIKSFISDK